MRKYFSLFLLLFLLPELLICQTNQALNSFVKSPIFKNAGLSVAFVDATSGKVIASYFPNQNLAPASTLKLITTATALEMFGPDFQFETEVAYSGKITDGLLDGDLYVIGHGDPTIGSQYSQQPSALFDTILSALRKREIRQIFGKIVGDESAYNNQLIPPKTTWEDMGNYYAAGVSALNYADNSYRLSFRTGGAGSTPQITDLEPSIEGLKFENHLVSKANDKDSAYIYGMPFQYQRYLYGTVPSNRATFTIKGDVPDPAFFFVSQLSSFLQRNGIQVKQKPETNTIKAKLKESQDSKLTKLLTFKSDKLSHIVQITNKKSYNFYAEALLRLIASKASNDASLPAGIASIRKFWSDHGLSTDFLMYDGSGLSPANRVNSAFFVRLLNYMATKSQNKDLFISSLAIAGNDGTLKSFLANTSLSGKVYAKSGSFEGVLSYCGKMNKNNRSYLFCIITNAFTCSPSEVKKATEKLLLDF
ncbi:MAG: D-alanyl-D-alanine carboxypeptidase/D-alanyl-D-alanine-endopeptidase [Bacteroidales bacterium]|nr:D-alanyl-D-alanine carboxypeptidase/D-alanyl-D-alanine-endopeptidase [Bacteroidales bacterium]